MRIPDRLVSLTEEGVVETVVRPLMSGKEAQVYLVIAGGEQRVAKVYKEAHLRSFQQRALYTEGRKLRNSRDQRAIDKRSRHGREQDEAAWRAAEVDVIYRLQAAGVRVPKPHQFIDGVLIMELITDAAGQPAPRLGDVSLDRAQALAVFERLLADIVRMLCAGVVHGDLSTFNVLMASSGPVIIDFPQAVNPASNQNARKLLLRDVDNLQRFLSAFAPERAVLPYAQEMWELYERGELTADTVLRGQFRAPQQRVDTRAVQALILDAERDARRHQQQAHRPLRHEPNRGGGPGFGSKRERGGPARNEHASRREPIVQIRRDSQPPLRREVEPPQPARSERNIQAYRDPVVPAQQASSSASSKTLRPPQGQAPDQTRDGSGTGQRRRRRRRRR